jgi:glucan phosphoethanolaminetransferase (alkaline phosphatase superfamily)
MWRIAVSVILLILVLALLILFGFVFIGDALRSYSYVANYPQQTNAALTRAFIPMEFSLGFIAVGVGVCGLLWIWAWRRWRVARARRRMPYEVTSHNWDSGN